MLTKGHLGAECHDLGFVAFWSFTSRGFSQWNITQHSSLSTIWTTLTFDMCMNDFVKDYNAVVPGSQTFFFMTELCFWIHINLNYQLPNLVFIYMCVTSFNRWVDNFLLNLCQRRTAWIIPLWHKCVKAMWGMLSFHKAWSIYSYFILYQ